MNLSLQFHPAPKPSHGRHKPKRGARTRFSPNVRKQIIERDNGQCVRCGKAYHSIHHVVFASSGGEGTKSNGVCVCIICHNWAHAGREGREWFEQYRMEHLREC